MAEKKKPDQGKLRTREHIVADLAVNHFERLALLCGYTIERTTHDYGIDLLLVTFSEQGEVRPGFILIQMKGTDKLKFVEGKSKVLWRIARSDLIAWRAEIFPVLLVVYDAKEDVAYWLHIQAYIANRKGFNLFTAGNTINVRIPASQVVTSAAIRQFAEMLSQEIASHSEGSD